MAKKKKRGAKIYAVCLSVYILILTAACVYGLSIVWDYAVEYENAVPTNVMDEYVANLSENLWDDSIAETISSMKHEVQTDEECGDIVKEMLANEISYVRMPSASSQDMSISYRLRCGDSNFGVVTLIEDESKADQVKFGMLPWKVQKEEFDFTGLYTSVQITVPSAYKVELNGVRLEEQYIVEDSIPYDVLSDYYERFPNLPTKVTYKFDNIIGHLEPLVFDENGEEVKIDPEKDDSQFLMPVSEDKLARFEGFTQEFVERYKTFIAGRYEPSYGYQRLLPYVKLGSELDEILKMAQDGISWMHKHPPQLSIDEIKFNSAIYLGNDIYALDISSTVTTDNGQGPVQRSENMKLIVVDSGNEIRAVTMDIY